MSQHIFNIIGVVGCEKESEMKELLGVDSSTLAKWWCDLNRWKWPDELPDPEPPEVDVRRGKIMDEIMRIIGHKECLREWNKDSMPGKQFDDWYSRNGLC